jgi:O-antigen/teichoic acid export membrane protein
MADRSGFAKQTRTKARGRDHRVKVDRGNKGRSVSAQVMRSGAGNGVLMFCGTILSFFLALLLARALGPERYGVYAFVFALISLLAIPAQSGLTSLMVRETAKALSTQKWGLMRGIWQWAMRAGALYWLVMVLVTGGLACAFAGRIADGHLVPFAWGLVLGFFVVLEDTRSGAALGLGNVIVGQLPEMVLRRAFLIALVLGVILLYPTHNLTATNVLALHALAEVTALALGVGMLWKVRPARLTSAVEPVYEKNQWRRAVLPLALPAGIQLANQNMGILLVGAFWTAADVGVYRIALRGATFVAFGLLAMNWVAGPQFARFHPSRDIDHLRRPAVWSARASFAIGSLVALVFIIWGGGFLGLIFGRGFSKGYVALSILAVGQLVSTAVGPLDFLLNMTGHERTTARIAVGTLVCNIIFSFALIPKLGMNGAALATALTLVIWNAALYRAVRRLLGVSCCAFVKIDKQEGPQSRLPLPLEIQDL